MTGPTLLITAGGKHPAAKWAQLAADEIAQIGKAAPREAHDFKTRLVNILTEHHQWMMDHEQKEIKAGRHHPDLPYDTEEYSRQVTNEICNILAHGTPFKEHFKKANVREWVEGICNKYFKSAKMVERQHFHSEKAKAAPPVGKKKKN
jgi:hypothetical protein